jgi:hypothetical protein
MIYGADSESSSRWYGGRHPRELTTDEFLEQHRTGWIRPDAYQQYQSVAGLAWLGSARDYPLVGDTLDTQYGVVMFRRRAERLTYVAHDTEGELLRDARGLALCMSEQDVIARGLPTHSDTIVAFLGQVPIGFVSNEWGAVGAWVAERYQRRGIGTRLVRLHLALRPQARLGQMTPAGAALARAIHRSFVNDTTAGATPKEVSSILQEHRSAYCLEH